MAATQPRVGIVPGPGVVVRFGPTIGVFAPDTSPDEPFTAAWLDRLARLESAEPPAAEAVAWDAAELLIGHRATAPIWGAAVRLSDGYLILLHGAVRAVVDTPSGRIDLSGAQDLTWLDRRIPDPIDRIALSLTASGDIVADPRSDLRGGLVPTGSGVVLTPAQHRTPPPAGWSPGQPPGYPARSPHPIPGTPSQAPRPQPVASAPPPMATPPAAAVQRPAPNAPPPARPPQPGPPSSLDQRRFAGPPPLSGPVPPAGPGPQSGPVPQSRPVPRPGPAPQSGPVPPPGPIAPPGAAPLSGPVPRPAPSPRPAPPTEGSPTSTVRVDPDQLAGEVPPPSSVTRRGVADGAGPDETQVVTVSCGVLVADDGTRTILDRDYVFGRDPGHDPAVTRGGATPISVDDPDSLVSRVQTRISVMDGIVTVSDASSANGTFIAAPGAKDWTRIGTVATVLPEGWSIRLGRRVFTHTAAKPASAASH